MRFAPAVSASLVNAVASIAPQIAALLLLPAPEFGAFSLLYLIYALGSSVSFSVICEPPVRARLGGSTQRDRPDDQVATATWLSLGFGLIAAVVAVFVLHGFELVAAMGVAVAAATYRVSGRYREVLDSRWSIALRADTIGTLTFCAAVVVLMVTGVPPLDTVALSWALGALAGAFGGVRPKLRAPTVVPRWIRQHRTEIRDLLGESIVLDAGAIGGPYLVAPILGLTNFGIYRGISNVAAPVRLVLNSVRPRLAAMSGRGHRVRQLRRLVAMAAIVAGIGTWVVLFVIGQTGVQLGVLTALSGHAVEAGLFVGFNLVGHFEYLVARPAAARLRLVAARGLQSGTVFVLPVLGALVWGLGGAIWGLVVATVFGAAVWVVVGRGASGAAPPRAGEG